MNLINISNIFLKKAQQLNLNKEEELIPEPLHTTDKQTGLDYSLKETGRDRYLEEKDIYPGDNDLFGNYIELQHKKIDLETFKFPKITPEYAKQLITNRINKIHVLMKEYKEEDLDVAKQYGYGYNNLQYNYNALLSEEKDLINNFESYINDIVDKSRELSLQLDELRHNYAVCKNYLYTYDKVIEATDISIRHLLQLLPSVIASKLYNTLSVDIFGGNYKKNISKITFTSPNSILNSIRDLLYNVSGINREFKDHENEIRQYIIKVENFINEYLSDDESLKNLEYLEKYSKDNVKNNLLKLLNNTSYVLRRPQSFIENLSYELDKHSIGIISDIREKLEDSVVDNIFNNINDKYFDETLKDCEEEVFSKLDGFGVKYLKISGSAIEVEADDNLNNFLLNEFQINFKSIPGSEKIKKITLYVPSRYWYYYRNNINNFIRSKVDFNNKDLLKSEIVKKYYKDFKSRICSDISRCFDKDLSDILYFGGGLDNKSIVRLIKNLFPEAKDNDVINFYKLLSKDKTLFEELCTEVYNIKLINVLSSILSKENKLNSTYMARSISFIKEFSRTFYQIHEDAPDAIKDDDLYKICSICIRGLETIKTDLENLSSVIETFHNEASGLSRISYFKILSNPNIFNFSKTAVVKKILTFYCNFLAAGGYYFINKNKQTISQLISLKAVSPNFERNTKLVIDFIEGGNKISGGISEELITAVNTAETELQFIKDSEVYKKYFKIAEKKEQTLYNLNMYINNNLRFRVLKDKDPRHLRIGIETNCCQRVGGAAESCVVDSFINHLAGILILEEKDPETGDWDLLTQSYFHYVPEDQGFILDNIESSFLAKKQDNYKLAQYYNLLANNMAEAGCNYFLAGKGYSDIKVEYFKSTSLKKDPRTYHDNMHNVYSDFEHDDAMDLLQIKDK